MVSGGLRAPQRGSSAFVSASADFASSPGREEKIHHDGFDGEGFCGVEFSFKKKTREFETKQGKISEQNTLKTG